MSLFSLLSIVFPIFGIAAGLAVYEMLTRRFLPAKASLSDGSRSWRHGWETAGRAALVSVARRLDRLMPIARFDSEERREALDRAGMRLEPETWRGVRGLCMGGSLALAAILVLSAPASLPLRLGAVMAGGAIGWVAPSGLLALRTKRRRSAIEAQLPDAMELIGIAVAAGSPVEQCFREVAASLESPLSDEFLLVDREVNLLGRSREEALEKLVRRCGSQDVGTFVGQLVQAINQGSSIAESLVSQAALAREMAQTAVLERIRKMPTKLDIVLSFCFLPPTVVLVIAPTVANLASFLNETLQ